MPRTVIRLLRFHLNDYHHLIHNKSLLHNLIWCKSALIIFHVSIVFKQKLVEPFYIYRIRTYKAVDWRKKLLIEANVMITNASNHLLAYAGKELIKIIFWGVSAYNCREHERQYKRKTNCIRYINKSRYECLTSPNPKKSHIHL